MRRFFLFALILFLIPLQLSYLFWQRSSSTGTVAGIETANSAGVNNSAFIGGFHFNLYGYSSPFAIVTFQGEGIYDQTTADDTGYFSFVNQFSPFSKREACLSAKDQFGRISAPVCLPPFPVKYNVSIGPVLIPPTISLNTPSVGSIYYVGDQVVLSGQTIPNSTVDLSMFTKNNNLNILTAMADKIFKPVYAFTFPKLTAQSDSYGNFSVVLPSSSSQSFNLFAQTTFDKAPSAESIRLNFQIYPYWMIVVSFFLLIIDFIRSRLLEIVIVAEIFYLVYFVLEYLLVQKALMIRPEEELAVREKHEIETKKF